MISRFLKRYADRFVSRWLVLMYDISVVYVVFLFAKLLRYNFDFMSISESDVKMQSVVVFLVYLSSFLIFRSFSGIIRHTSLVDALRIFRATAAAFVVLALSSGIAQHYTQKPTFLPGLAVVIIHFTMLTFVLIGSRFIVRTIYMDIIRKDRKKHVKVLIYGAGSAGMLTRNALIQDVLYYYEVVAFIDDNLSKVNKMLEGIQVVSAHKALNNKYIERNEISQLILAIPAINLDQKKQIIETGLELKIVVKVVPGIDRWINGQLSSSQLRDVRIEELLEREPIKLDNMNVSTYIHDKVVMVTGAAGSIGSEIVRQVLQYKPARVLLIDQAESPLYDLQFEIDSNPAFKEFTNSVIYLIASVKDRIRME